MTTSITIRNLEDQVKIHLPVRAADKGRFMEREVRFILRNAVERSPSSRNLAEVVHLRFGPGRCVDLELPLREAMREPPSFD